MTNKSKKEIKVSKPRIKVPESKTVAAFKMLREKSLFEAAVECGIDKYFDNKAQIINYMYRSFLKIRSNPEAFAISPDIVEEVEDKMSRRNLYGKDRRELINEEFTNKLANIKDADVKQIVHLGRNKAAIILDRKMDMLLQSKKALAKENIVSLAKVFGIYFDKAQIINGQATEHIAIMAKGVKDDITPEEALNELIKRREKHMEGNTD